MGVVAAGLPLRAGECSRRGSVDVANLIGAANGAADREDGVDSGSCAHAHVQGRRAAHSEHLLTSDLFEFAPAESNLRRKQPCDSLALLALP